MQSSWLEDSGDLIVGGTFNHGDYSKVTAHGTLQLRNLRQFASDVLSPAVYFLTNGTLRVDHGIYMAGFFGPGQFVQYGGSNSTMIVQVDLEGELDIYGGELTATNGIQVGFGDYADQAYFYQYGGSVKADTIINGRYFLNGGTITGAMTMAWDPSQERADAYVVQNGGTNFAASMDLGHPNIFGGRANYALSNGVVHVDTVVTFRGGQFSQYNGANTVVSNFLMQGTGIGGLGFASADYLLAGGTLSAAGLTAQAANFEQTGGTNLIAGDLTIIGVLPPQPPGPPQVVNYKLGGGLLSARNLVVNADGYGGFRQFGGSAQIAEKLTVRGGFSNSLGYALEGGTLAVKDIFIGDGAFFEHTRGSIIHSGVLTLSQGNWHAATGDHSLGPLQLMAGQSTNSAINFPDGSSILRLANSSAQNWGSDAVLYIRNWHGSASGGGATQLYFGSDSSGLTPQQLAQIQFAVSGELAPARILATGEVVPDKLLTFLRSGNSLTLTWGPGWFLQSAKNVAGPYQDLSGATSSYTVSLTGPQQFFRLRN